jgi:hypothetical protein
LHVADGLVDCKRKIVGLPDRPSNLLHPSSLDTYLLAASSNSCLRCFKSFSRSPRPSSQARTAAESFEGPAPALPVARLRAFAFALDDPPVSVESCQEGAYVSARMGLAQLQPLQLTESQAKYKPRSDHNDERTDDILNHLVALVSCESGDLAIFDFNDRWHLERLIHPRGHSHFRTPLRSEYRRFNLWYPVNLDDTHVGRALNCIYNRRQPMYLVPRRILLIMSNTSARALFYLSALPARPLICLVFGWVLDVTKSRRLPLCIVRTQSLSRWLRRQ